MTQKQNFALILLGLMLFSLICWVAPYTPHTIFKAVIVFLTGSFFVYLMWLIAGALAKK